MPDEIIDAAMACKLHTDACRARALLGWIVMKGLPDYPGEYVARLATDAPTPYVLLADTLDGLRAQLPAQLVRSERQLADPPEVVEIWFCA